MLMIQWKENVDCDIIAAFRKFCSFMTIKPDTMRNLSLLLIAALFACNSPQTSNTGTDSTTGTTSPAKDSIPSGSACYMKTVGKDTFLLQLIINDDQVAGKLDYNFYEKDKSSGTLTGTLKDNILRASYSYQAEGMNNHRPVVFKVMKDQVYEAQADSFDGMGVPVFSTADSQLKFDPTPYKKQDCK